MIFIREMVLFLLVCGALSVKAKPVSSEQIAQSMCHQVAIILVGQHSFVVEGSSIYGTPLYSLPTLLFGKTAPATERLVCTPPVMPVMTHRPFT
jgi:hypothetical protein